LFWLGAFTAYAKHTFNKDRKKRELARLVKIGNDLF